jgi:hypothetical protein
VRLQILEIEAASSQARVLPIPGEVLEDISGNEWQVSPDGRQFVYLSASERSLWVMRLPGR